MRVYQGHGDLPAGNPQADRAEVPIVILRPNDKIPVSFRMLKAPQGWMIYDLLIEGVSLADNYRASSPVMHSGRFVSEDLLQSSHARHGR